VLGRFKLYRFGGLVRLYVLRIASRAEKNIFKLFITDADSPDRFV
jgi:hypothetical protein